MSVREAAVEKARTARMVGRALRGPERRLVERDHSLDAFYQAMRTRLRAEIREDLRALRSWR